MFSVPGSHFPGAQLWCGAANAEQGKTQRRGHESESVVHRNRKTKYYMQLCKVNTLYSVPKLMSKLQWPSKQ